MAVSRALGRLLRVREIEEEQSKIELESALGDLRRMEGALAAARTRERGGRLLVNSSARSGELRDRLAGLEETRAAVRRAEALERRIAEAEADVAELRQDYLARRVDRRQAETLIDEARAKDALVAARRGQQALDDWYLNRLVAEERAANPRESSDAGPVEEEAGAPDEQATRKTASLHSKNLDSKILESMRRNQIGIDSGA